MRIHYQIERIVTLTAFSLLALSVCLTADEPKPWNVRDHIPLQEFIIQCHRGAGKQFPENSMEAFETAWKWGTIPEADLKTTKDGVIVTFHDDSFSRILPDAPAELKQQGIAKLTLAEVKQLDIGAWKGPEYKGQRVATMAEVTEALKKHPQRKIYIDIKSVDFLQLANETKEVHPQLIFTSTNYNEILLWKRLAPASQTLLWMGGDPTVIERLDRLEKHRFDSVDQLQIHVSTDAAGKFSPSGDFLRNTGERLRKCNVLFQTLPWSGSHPEVYKRLMDLGVASFATDYPDVAMQAVAEYYNTK